MNNIDSIAEALRAQLSSPPDFCLRDIKTSFFYGKIIYFDGFIDVKELEKSVIDPLLSKNAPFSDTLEGLRGIISYGGNLKETEPQKALDSLLSGCALLLTGSAIIEIPAKKPPVRAVEEPPTSSVIKGPREGFVESVKINCTLIRKRIRNENLILKEISSGTRTGTKIVIAYLKDVVRPQIAETVEKRINAIEIDGVIDSSYLTKILEDRPYSLFKQIGNSEKPDVIAARILDGKVAVLCDGSPIALYLPFTLVEDFEDAQDNYKRPLRATFLRYTRIFAAFLALLLPALFVSVQVYQFQLLPVELLATVINSTGNIPFSPTLEMLIALVLFEVLGEASIRMPKQIGVVLGVVGAIVLGDTAVTAGLLSSLTVLVVAMSGIGLYAVPDEVGALGILRILFVVAAGLLGLLGILILGMCVIAYLSSMTSCGVPYLLPVAPISKNDLKDLLMKMNITDLKNRPDAYRLLDKVRLRRIKG